jgi:threonyl-tRNA synthetase
MAEFGSCHRNEPSGTLHGLMRVRNFVQDDAHIFCTEEQIQAEVSAFMDLLFGSTPILALRGATGLPPARPSASVDEPGIRPKQALENWR